jgi:hypothetical protein
MGLPCCDGRGSSRTDAPRARDLASMAFRRRDSSGISRRQKAICYSSRSTGMSRLFHSVRRACGERGERGSLRLRNRWRGALTASRKNGSPAPTMISLGPQHYHQSRASRRCANPRTENRQLSASRCLNSRI